MPAILERDAQGGTRVIWNYETPPLIHDFLHDPAFATGLAGPLGSAKTTAGCFKVWNYANAFPGAKILITRATWPALRDTTQDTFFQWFPPGVMGQYRATTKTFELAIGGGRQPAEILFRALDDREDIANVLSLDLAAAFLDEPQGGLNVRSDGGTTVEPGMNHDLFLAILGRLGRQAGEYPRMLWLTFNPPAPSHWIAKEFQYDPGASGHDVPTNPRAGWKLYCADQETNRAHLPKATGALPGYYEHLEALYGHGTPMCRRYVWGHWIEFASEQPFQRPWVRYWGDAEEPRPALESLVVEAGFDAAVSKADTACKSSLVVAGQCRRGVNRGRIYQLHHVSDRWTIYEQVAAIVAAAREWKFRVIRMGRGPLDAGVRQVLEHEARQAGVPLAVEAMPEIGDKLMRANGWSALVEKGMILFAPTAGPLVSSLVSVPGDAAGWDDVDAMGHCVRGFPVLPAESSPLPGTGSEPTRARSYAMGRRTAGRAEPRAKAGVAAGAPAEPGQRAKSYRMGRRGWR